MLNFLIALDPRGTIEKVKWTTAPELIYAGQSLLRLLDQKNSEKVREFLEKTRLEQDFQNLTLQVETPQGLIQLSLYLIRLEETNLALGISGDLKSDPIIEELIKTYNDTFNQLREEIKKRALQEEEGAQEKFEELQKLNNELNNTRRKIEKANYKLQNINQDLQVQLSRDPLTGLVGRFQFWVGLRDMVDSDPDRRGVFVYIDIDNFKEINDTFGHVGGDQFLVEVAERIKALPLEQSLKIRIAGDEFGIYAHGWPEVGEQDLQNLWEQIQEYLLQEPVYFNEIAIPVSISAGMAVYGEDTDQLEELIEFADFAMYQAKKEGKNCYRGFRLEHFQEQRVRLQQSKAVQEVLEQKDLHHVYQPIYSAINGRIFGYAALMRTDNAFFLNTEDLVEQAFRENLYLDLDLLSFDRLFKDQELVENLEEKMLFVAHGPYSFQQNPALKKQENQDFLNRLVLELVEVQMARPRFIEEIIENAGDFGFKVALSNFAAGAYDDLGMLTAGPNFVKIGRPIIRDIVGSAVGEEKVRRIVQYAQSQHTRVIIEGIENIEELQAAVRLNADFLQGYYLGSPARELPPEREEITGEILDSRGQ